MDLVMAIPRTLQCDVDINKGGKERKERFRMEYVWSDGDDDEHERVALNLINIYCSALLRGLRMEYE